MADEVSREPALDPQDLERLLVSREIAGDVDGMAALYEPHAVLDRGGGQLTLGRDAIRTFYANLVATGRKFDLGHQLLAIISGDAALTSTRLPDGSVTAEVDRVMGHGCGSSISSPLRSASTRALCR
ncbi:MAG TPA: nuclear transport factor 2 family protein [Candidatus Polarisedimenticolia bacterium]|nr:nuclear transport factor 2 family protein [Candidatus Polarisedimenticolia bacterium]